jgi:hypothetical protein
MMPRKQVVERGTVARTLSYDRSICETLARRNVRLPPGTAAAGFSSSLVVAFIGLMAAVAYFLTSFEKGSLRHPLFVRLKSVRVAYASYAAHTPYRCLDVGHVRQKIKTNLRVNSWVPRSDTNRTKALGLHQANRRCEGRKFVGRFADRIVGQRIDDVLRIRCVTARMTFHKGVH